MADIITQAELRAVWNIFCSLGNASLGIRRRMKAGAEVEPGGINAYSDTKKRYSIEAYERDLNPKTASFNEFGLDLDFDGPWDVEEPAPSKKPLAATSEHELPEWLDETPIMEYTLEATSPNHGIEQTVLMTLEEYMERAFLATCQKIYRRDRGCHSPFEEFFSSLVIRAEICKWPTPDEVADELEKFREDFEFMREAVLNFVEAYPEKPAQSEQPEEPRNVATKAR